MIGGSSIYGAFKQPKYLADNAFVLKACLFRGLSTLQGLRRCFELYNHEDDKEEKRHEVEFEMICTRGGVIQTYFYLQGIFSPPLSQLLSMSAELITRGLGITLPQKPQTFSVRHHLLNFGASPVIKRC